jgi:hypothetical protein
VAGAGTGTLSCPANDLFFGFGFAHRSLPFQVSQDPLDAECAAGALRRKRTHASVFSAKSEGWSLRQAFSAAYTFFGSALALTMQSWVRSCCERRRYSHQ